MQVSIMMSPYIKGSASPKDLIRFPWEQGDPEHRPEEKHLSAEEHRARMHRRVAMLEKKEKEDGRKKHD